MNNIKNVVEALIFASGEPLGKKDIVEKIPALTTRELTKIIEELKEQYSGDSGILLLSFNDKYQFSTNPAYGDTLAEVLTPIKERELSKSLLEVLAIIAYRQPITRPELEEIRGVTTVEYQISMLAKAGLIEVVGRKDAVGHPVLFGTTDEFLKRFQLENIEDLPDYGQVLERIAVFEQNYNASRDTLYANRKIFTDDTPDEIIVGPDKPEYKIPDILTGPRDKVSPENEKFTDDDFDIFSDDDDDDDFLDGEDVEIFE